MKKLIAIALSLCFFYSCTQLKISASQQNKMTDLGIEYQNLDNVNEIYMSTVDSVLDAVITQFNSEHHSLMVHKKRKRDEDYLTLSFDKTRFVTNAGRAVGYSVSGLGLLVSPVAVATATSGQAFLAFYYLPEDYLHIRGQLSPAITDYPDRNKLIYVEADALFAKKSRRVNKIGDKLGDSLRQLLQNLDMQMQKNK